MRCKAFRTPDRDRLIDVLPLASVTLGGNHHSASDLVGDLTAELATDKVQACVDARGGTRAGDQVAVVDEQHVAVHLGGRESAGQVVGVHPVGGAGPAV